MVVAAEAVKRNMPVGTDAAHEETDTAEISNFLLVFGTPLVEFAKDLIRKSHEVVVRNPHVQLPEALTEAAQTARRLYRSQMNWKREDAGLLHAMVESIQVVGSAVNDDR